MGDEDRHCIKGWLSLENVSRKELYRLERFLSTRMMKNGQGRDMLELYLSLHDEAGEEELWKLPWQITPEVVENVNQRRRNTIRSSNWINRVKPLELGQKVLDLGCGGGMFGIIFAQQNASVYGIDIEPDVINIAKVNAKRHGVNANYSVGSAEKIPYQDNFFDFCIANSLLEHVDDWQAVIHEIKRVLKKDGLVFIATTNKLHPFQSEINKFPFYPWLPRFIKGKVLSWIMENRRDLVNYGSCPAIHWFSHNQLKKYLHNLGFEIYDVTDTVEPEDLRGAQRLAKPILRFIKRSKFLKSLCYFYLGTVSIWAIKK